MTVAKKKRQWQGMTVAKKKRQWQGMTVAKYDSTKEEN
jgi:hypothetical protein